MGLFGKIATLAAVALPGKAISASRAKTTSAAGGTPPPPPPPPAAGGVKAKTTGPGPGSIGGIGGIAAAQGQGQGRQSSMNNAFRAGQPPAPPSGSAMSVWEAGSQRRADKTKL